MDAQLTHQSSQTLISGHEHSTTEYNEYENNGEQRRSMPDKERNKMGDSIENIEPLNAAWKNPAVAAAFQSWWHVTEWVQVSETM